MWAGLFSNLRNVVIIALITLLIMLAGFASFRGRQVAARDRTIATQADDLKAKAAAIEAQKNRIEALQGNIENIQASQVAMQKVQVANRKLKAQIAQLSGVKDDGRDSAEARVYSDMFDFFVSGGMPDNGDVSGGKTGQDLLSGAGQADSL